MRKNNLLLVLCVWIISCSTPVSEGIYIPENLDRRERTRFQQYVIQGKILYKSHCQNCHQPDGKGMERLYPPLAKSDFLLANIGKSACGIKNGQQGSIVVNGIEYNQPMPGVPDLTPIEIAEILTYISNSWGNQHGFVSVQDVQKFLRECDPTP